MASTFETETVFSRWKQLFHNGLRCGEGEFPFALSEAREVWAAFARGLWHRGSQWGMRACKS